MTQTPQQRKQAASDRAEQIRLGKQQLAVLYTKAIEERDWEVLGYRSVKAWRIGEFGPDRFGQERRKEIVAEQTGLGWTTREIAEATGDSHQTVIRDQAELRPPSPDPALSPPPPNQNPRQQAARDREQARRRQRNDDTDDILARVNQSLTDNTTTQPGEEDDDVRDTTINGQPLWENEETIAWTILRINAGATRDDLVRESREATHGWPHPGTRLTRVSYDRCIGIIHERSKRRNRNGNSQPRQPKPARYIHDICDRTSTLIIKILEPATGSEIGKNLAVLEENLEAIDTRHLNQLANALRYLTTKAAEHQERFRPETREDPGNVIAGTIERNELT